MRKVTYNLIDRQWICQLAIQKFKEMLIGSYNCKLHVFIKCTFAVVEQKRGRNDEDEVTEQRTQEKIDLQKGRVWIDDMHRLCYGVKISNTFFENRCSSSGGMSFQISESIKPCDNRLCLWTLYSNVLIIFDISHAQHSLSIWCNLINHIDYVDTDITDMDALKAV